MLTEEPRRAQFRSPTGPPELLQVFARALGQRRVDDDAEGVLGEEGGDAPDARAQRAQGGGGLLVAELFNAEGFRRAPERPAQAVEREVALGQHLAARLKISEGVEHQALGFGPARRFFSVEKGRLAHRLTGAGREPQGALARRGRTRASVAAGCWAA